MHTPEPWLCIELSDGRAVIYSRGSIEKGPIGFVHTFAAGRRIVACVNALAGISTEALENIAAGRSTNPAALRAALMRYLEENE